MNSNQFDALMKYVFRFVDAFERDVERKQEEWEQAQKDFERRKQALDVLTGQFQQAQPEDDQDVGLGDLFDEEEDDESSGS